MSDRFESYLRQAADLVRDGDFSRAEGFERLARQTLEALGSPPRLAARLHAHRGERAMRQADYPLAEQAFTEAIAALREAGGGGRELFDLLQRHRAGALAPGRGRARARGVRRGDRARRHDRPGVLSRSPTRTSRAPSRCGGCRAAPTPRQSLRAAIAVAEHAPVDGRERIAQAARDALDALRPEPRRPAARPR